MENNEKIYGKYTQKDIDFFDALAEKYCLEQNEDQLIIVKKDGSKIYLPKWYEVPIKNGKKIDIEDLIKKSFN